MTRHDPEGVGDAADRDTAGRDAADRDDEREVRRGGATAEDTPPRLDRGSRMIVAVVLLALAAVLLTLLVTNGPAWWVDRIGGVADGSPAVSIIAGLLLGAASTALALLAAVAALSRTSTRNSTRNSDVGSDRDRGGERQRRPRRRGRLLGWGAVCLVVALPDLFALLLALHPTVIADQSAQVLDRTAPFHLWAAGVGALVGLGLVVLAARGRRQRIRARREIERLRSERGPGGQGPAADRPEPAAPWGSAGDRPSEGDRAAEAPGQAPAEGDSERHSESS